MSTPARAPIPPYLARPEGIVFLGIALLALICLPSVPDLVDGLVASGDLKFARALLQSAPAPRSPFDTARRARQRADMAILEGDLAQGIAYQREAVAAWPNGLGHRVRLAMLQEAACAPDKAREALEDARAQYQRWVKDDRPELLAVARDVVQLAPAELPTRDTLAARVEDWWVENLRRLGAFERLQLRPKEALDVQRELVKLRPQTSELWQVLALLEGEAGDREASRAALAEAAKMGGSAELHELLSYRFEWTGHGDGALEELSAARLDRERTRERALMLLLRNLPPKQALVDYRRRYPADMDRVAQYLVTVRLLGDRGETREARAVLAIGLKEYPRNRDLLQLASDLDSAAGDVQGAWRAAKVLAELDPERLEVQLRAVDAAEGANLRAEAEALLARATEIAGRQLAVDPEVDRTLGIRLAQLSRFALAKPRLERALALDPNDGLVLFHMARCLLEDKQPAKAAEMYQKLLALESQGLTVAPRTAPLELPAGPPEPAPPAVKPLPRRVLAFYKPSGGQRSDFNLVHANVEAIFNHLGLHVDYRSAEEPLPTDAEMERYRGVVTWFRTEKMRHASVYAAWATRQLHAGRRFVIFDHVGCTLEADSGRPIEPGAIQGLYDALGLKRGAEWTDEPASIQVVHADAEMCEYERPLGREAGYLADLQATRQQKVYLRLKRTSGTPMTCDAVFVGPNGGFALDGYTIYYEPEGQGHRWRLNPFRFVTEALALGTEPRLDPTTRDGVRVLYQHIDGDASNQLVSDRPQKTCAELMLEEVIEKRPYLFTMSFIGQTVDATAGASPRDIAAARRIFAHPRVEAAHHSYTHPFNWRPKDGALDAKQEIVRAREVMERLCPPGKTARIALWSGQANPERAVLSTAYADGQRNLNAGGAMFDPNHDSRLYLVPFVRDVGGLIQNLTSARDDFGITDNLTLPAVCFANVIPTYERTASPRLLPVNVYGHFYTLTNAGARRGMELIQDWLQRHVLHSVWVSEYLKMLEGFRSGVLTEVALDEYEVRDHGACRTVRFDGRPAGTGVDLARSTGVSGWNHHAGSLYVHLAGPGPARIALSSAPRPLPHVASSTVDLRDVKLTDYGVAVTADALVPVALDLAGFPPNAPVEVRFDDAAETRTATAEGRVELAHAPAGGPLKISVRTGGTR